jgi:2-haloacid dehalogenase
LIDWSRIRVLSFDCYGTLIDWESGIISALNALLSRHCKRLADENLLELYAQAESRVEKGKFVKYRKVLMHVVKKIAETLAFTPSKTDLDCLSFSLPTWKPFQDTNESLRRLKARYKLAIISNIDNDLLLTSIQHMKVKFDFIITSEEARAYKPDLRVFQLAIRKTGVRRNEILHVAQSLYHDICPARRLRIFTVWMNRTKRRQGFGATPRASCRPDLEVSDMKTFADIVIKSSSA